MALAVALALALLLPGLGAAPLDDPGEGQHAEIAREAAASGDWVVLRLNGVPYLDKPPLLYALVAGAYRLAGVTEWSARLPAVAGAAAAVAGTALLGVRLLGPAGGLLAGAALLSCALFAAFARYVRPETLFVAAIQWGFAGLLLGAGSGQAGAAPGAPRRGWTLAGCAALGVAALAKDPLGLVGPLAAVGAAAAAARGRWRVRVGWAGGLVLAALGLGWYALAAAATPGFLWYVAVDNHLLNAVQRRQFPDEDVPLGGLEFLATAGLGAFPWIVPAALMAAALVRRRAWREPAEAPWVALAAWGAGVLALFALLPFKLPHYGLPAYPALVLLAARWWVERPATARAPALGHLALLAVLGGAAAWCWAGDGRALTGTVLAAADVTARKAAAAALPAAAPAWADLRPLVGAAALAAGAGVLGLGVAAARRSCRLAAAVSLAAALAFVPLVSAGLAAVTAARSVRGLAGELRARLGPADLLVHEGPIEQSAALELYAGRRPRLVDGTRSVLGFGATTPGAEDIFWTEGRLRDAWTGPRRIWLVTARPPRRSVTATLPSAAHEVAAMGGRRLYSNRPAP